MDLALNNLQRLICHKTKQTNQPTMLTMILYKRIWKVFTFLLILKAKIISCNHITSIHDYTVLKMIFISIYLGVFTAITMVYKNTNVMVHSPNGDIDFSGTAARVLQRDTWASYIFIICLDYVLWTSVNLTKENSLTLKKVRSRRCPAEIITDADFTDDLALFVYTPAQVEFLLHDLEPAARGIVLYMNSDKRVPLF